MPTATAVPTWSSPRGSQAGYFPLTFSGGWSRRSFQRYRQVPGVGLDDPRVRLVDLDGDGLTDVLHSGSRLQCCFNDADPPGLAAQRPGAVAPSRTWIFPTRRSGSPT